MTAGRTEPGRGRARTLRLQGLANVMVRALLRIPLLSRVVGRNLLTLYVVGRKSGKRFTVPVTYTRHEGDLLVGSPFAWGRNLRTGEPVEVRHLGRRRLADVRVLTEEAAVVEEYGVIARDVPSFAGFNNIRLDENGDPDPGDLQLAWAAGARVFRLTLR
ncbi:nitroreductase/quinone reductase family protein [Couchioplanes caeruleus]|nr:nitroreductase/quinone reductase family protein [Couchioplanes caeruleus]ROP28623.1 uncharacterized protein DUF385 [Couchioplanes caeruleus]